MMNFRFWFEPEADKVQGLCERVASLEAKIDVFEKITNKTMTDLRDEIKVRSFYLDKWTNDLDFLHNVIKQQGEDRAATAKFPKQKMKQRNGVRD